jgi:hypothetical protein
VVTAGGAGGATSPVDCEATAAPVVTVIVAALSFSSSTTETEWLVTTATAAGEGGGGAGVLGAGVSVVTVGALFVAAGALSVAAGELSVAAGVEGAEGAEPVSVLAADAAAELPPLLSAPEGDVVEEGEELPSSSAKLDVASGSVTPMRTQKSNARIGVRRTNATSTGMAAPEQPKNTWPQSAAAARTQRD